MNKELRINLLKQACEDIKENADEPENDIYDMLDKMEELEEYKWDYDRDEYFLDLDITINL